MTDPIPENEVQTGTVYYDRKAKIVPDGRAYQGGGRQAGAKTYSVVGGEFKLFEGGALNQVTSFAMATNSRAT